ncbi:unnamed protein product [Phyllotreta striolata]|uniref:CBP80/20-dependent translation initiation factor-like n=1 Tax=Phyllotreta striolata TaxID=444603 RepID=A0A9N9XS85_PHYSR|nr:unnamed protein product [Phyllotreta striolata]
MSKSGVGRGRGWMNLQKNQQQHVLPINIHANETPKISLKDVTEFIDIENDELTKRIKELNINDDGIKFNQKIKFILEKWKQDCQTGEDVEKSFDVLYQECLNDEELASKIVILIASRSFITQEIHDQNLRLLFLKKLQSDFESCKILNETNPAGFRNYVKMLGEFYSKARLANGQPFSFMVTPLLVCLEMLLESAQLSDLQQFTTQIYLNGSSIKAECSDKLNDLINNIRILIIVEKNLSREGRYWLLLALEIAGNKFGALPIEVFKFYQEQIGSKAMAIFQDAQNSLSVQTVNDNKKLENYQSSVNVLQLSKKPDVPPAGNDQNSSFLSNCSELNASSTSTSGFVSDTSSQNSNGAPREASQKFGRPILGAGARLNKSKSELPNNRKEPSPGGWVKTNGPGWKDRGAEKNSKSKKGWQHDDRFDNDYS